ncbi:MAG: hypothetical protein AAF829_07810 [Pseudomonadota bacterium]
MAAYPEFAIEAYSKAPLKPLKTRLFMRTMLMSSPSPPPMLTPLPKNPPFFNGNKRAAFLAAATFLLINGHHPTVSEADATLKMLALAAGEMTAEQFADWLRAFTAPI